MYYEKDRIVLLHDLVKFNYNEIWLMPKYCQATWRNNWIPFTLELQI